MIQLPGSVAMPTGECTDQSVTTVLDHMPDL